MIYIIFPKILTGKDAEIHKAGRRKVRRKRIKSAIIDGIIPTSYFINYYEVEIKPEFLKSFRMV